MPAYERACIVLMAAEGMTNKAIAVQLGMDTNKVGRWRSRVAAEGIACIGKVRPRGANHGGKNTEAQAQCKRTKEAVVLIGSTV